jgi:hypothetical protein
MSIIVAFATTILLPVLLAALIRPNRLFPCPYCLKRHSEPRKHLCAPLADVLLTRQAAHERERITFARCQTMKTTILSYVCEQCGGVIKKVALYSPVSSDLPSEKLIFLKKCASCRAMGNESLEETRKNWDLKTYQQCVDKITTPNQNLFLTRGSEN